ncbi:MAG TPA: murein biosynthesis integral membrane protein MurJ [Chromatiaceae bacterium]|nr:murein biosynthesis integral membrane protein MurJ [Chromatiaceae bacterium]
MAPIAASLAKVGGNTLISRILGFVRDLVVARIFGADAATDAFFVAFRIPNLMRRLFAEGAFSLAFVPVLSEYRAKRAPAELRRFLDDTAGTLGLALLLITVLGILGAPLLVLAFAPGFADDPGQRVLAADMLRLTFPYVLFISLTALAGGILNTFGRFGVPAFTPVLLNLVLIACALWLAPHMERPIVALAWGVLIAGVVQLAFQVPFLARLGLLPRPRFNPRDPGVRRMLGLIGPSLLGVSVAQINMLLSTLLASFLAAGSISWLYYADRLMEFPLGVLGVAMGTVMLPKLSREHVGQSSEAFSRTLDWALRWVLLLGLPAALGLALLAGPLFVTLFYSDAFGITDVHMAGQALTAYGFGVLGFLGVMVLAPGYYARQQTRAPVRIALVSMLVNLILSLALMWPLGHAGLALATTLAALVNAGLLLRGLRLDGVYRPRPGWRRLLAQGFGAGLVMALLLTWACPPTEAWLALGHGTRALELLTWIGLGALAYGVSLLALGLRPRDLMPSV